MTRYVLWHDQVWRYRQAMLVDKGISIQRRISYEEMDVPSIGDWSWNKLWRNDFNDEFNSDTSKIVKGI